MSESLDNNTVRILLVEDDADTARSTQRLLTRAGYTVALATTGAEALEYVHANRPDLVLQDRNLPDGDGLEICRQIKADPALKSVFVVIISSSYTSKSHQMEGLEGGADGYISRPIGNHELLARVAAFVRIVKLNLQLRESEKNSRELADSLTVETRRLRESQTVANVGSWETNLDSFEVTWTEETYRIFEVSPEEFHPTHQRFLERVHPDDRVKVDEAFANSLGKKANGAFSIEHRICLPADRVKYLEERWRTFTDDNGKPARAVGTCQDITARKLADEALHMRARQQETIARIGFEATKATTLESIFDLATQSVAEALAVEYCKVLQLVPDGSHLRLVSGVGWKPGLVGIASVKVEVESQAGFTLKEDKAIYANDLRTEERFKPPPLLVEHGVISGLSVPINLRDKPWGVLGAHCRSVRQFNGEDCRFMESVASLLSVVIERLAIQRHLSESERRMREAQRIAQLGNWELDIQNNALSWSDEVYRIFGRDRADFGATFESFLETVHPEDRESLLAAQERALRGEDILMADHRILRPDGEIRYVRERGELIRDEAGHAVALAGTVLDITEQVNSEAERERMFNLSLDLLSVGTYDGRLEQVNPAWTRCLGWQATEITNRPWLDFVHPDDHPATFEAGEKLKRGETLSNFENRYRCKDGSYRWLSWNSYPLPETRQIFGVARDVTEQRRRQEQLRLLETCVSRINDIVLITEAEPIDEPGPRIIYVNDAFVTQTGYTREEAIGQTPRILQGPKTQRDVLDRIRIALEAWQPVREELINYTKSGEEFWVELDIAPVADNSGWFTHWVAVQRDITERRRAQDLIRESEQRFRGLFEQASVGMCLVSEEGQFLRINNRFCEILGYTPEELLAMNCIEATHADDRPREVELVARLIGGETETSAWEKRYLHKDGTSVWCNLTLSLLPADPHGATRFMGVIEDITERRAATAKIRRSEELLRLAGEAARLGAWSVEFPEVQITWSDEVCAIHEMPPGTVPELEQALGFYAPESLPIIEKAFTKCAQDGVPFDLELNIITAKGRHLWVRSIGRAEHDEKGVIRRVQGAFQDITASKQAEADAIRMAETLADIVQIQQELSVANVPTDEIQSLIATHAMRLTGAAGAVVALIDGPDVVYGTAKGMMEDKTGYRGKPSQTLSKLALSSPSVLHSEDTETDRRVNRAACRNENVRSLIAAPLCVGEEPIGSLKVVSPRPKCFVDRDVKNLQILAETLAMVMQRERAIEALRTSEQEFRTLAEAMPQIVWITDATGRTTYFNQNWMDYTGLTLEESLGHDWIQPFHPNDRPVAEAAWQRAVSSLSEYSLECRLRRADGEYRWWLIRGNPLLDAAGQVLKWFGTCTDINDLKLAELEINRTNRALKMLSSTNEVLIHASDETTLLEKVCQIAVEVGGYRMVWVGFVEDDEFQTLRPVAVAGQNGRYLEKVRISWSDTRPEGRGPAGRAIRDGEAVVCEDICEDASFAPWREEALKHGYKSMACLPLRHDERTFGLVVLYSAEVNRLSEAELKLLREMAADLAFGIVTLRARTERQRLHDAVLAIARGVSGGIGEGFFADLTHHLVQALQADVGFIALLDESAGDTAHTMAMFRDGQPNGKVEYVVSKTPGRATLSGKPHIVERDVRTLYPEDPMLQEMDIESFAGAPLVDGSGETIGLIAVLFRQPIQDHAIILSALQVFAARASSEMERQRADMQVHDQAALLDHAHEAILVQDLKGQIIYWNKGAERMYGWTAGEALGQTWDNLLDEKQEGLPDVMEQLLEKGEWHGEFSMRTKENRKLTTDVRLTIVDDKQNRPKSILAIIADITESKKVEAQFLRAQRMESIGTLAGGVAHDLNNVLAPIMLSLGTLKFKLPDAADQELLKTMEMSCRRGADLIKQVLGFARGVDGKRIQVNIAHLLRDLLTVMRDTFPKNIDVRFDTGADSGSVIGDPTQLHQVLLNLCLNARDAMPQGGRITITMENVTIDDTYAGMNPGSQPGYYLVIKVRDTGDGIPRGIQDRIFEPFFTTKEIGKGTGLGLSTTSAIVKSHGGFINLYSEEKKGTQFEVYLPANTGDSATQGSEFVSEASALPRGNHELVLVVDDEEAIRKITKNTLENFGYRVLLARNGAEALAIYAQNQNEVAVVLTDMAMPVMDGLHAIAALKSLNPDIKIVAASGLSSQMNGPKATSLGIKHFLPKPYNAKSILEILEEILAE